MSYLSIPELLRVQNLRPDVLSTLTAHMAEFERQTGRKSYVPPDGGMRTHERQRELYADSLDASGNVKPGYRAAPPGLSAHETGAAYHLRIVGAAADTNDPGYETLAQIGEQLGMIAGKHFKTGTPDPEHFETNESTDTRRRLWAEVVQRRLWRAALVVTGVGVGVGLWLKYRPRRRR